MIEKIGVGMFGISSLLFGNYMLIKIIDEFMESNAELVFVLIVVNAMVISLIIIGCGSDYV